MFFIVLYSFAYVLRSHKLAFVNRNCET